MNKLKLLIPVTVIGLIILLWFTRNISYCGWDFHNSLWGPVNMLIHHMTPYTYNAPYGPYPGVWMPPTLGLFFLIGYVPCDIASKVWLVAEMVGFLWVIWRIADYRMPSLWIYVICLFAFFLFPPLWLHITLGQFSLLFVILMIALIYEPKINQLAPLILILGLTKPQLAILIYPGYFINVWRQIGFYYLLKLFIITGISALVLVIPLFVFFPGWFNDFIYITFDNLGVQWYLPTLFVQLPRYLGRYGLGVWILVLLSALLISLWLWIRREEKIALIASLAMTPLVTPYASSWDFVLLLPAFFWLAIHLKKRYAQGVLFSGMFLTIVAQIATRWGKDLQDGSQWWIPPVLIMLYIVSLFFEKTQVFDKQRLAITGNT